MDERDVLEMAQFLVAGWLYVRAKLFAYETNIVLDKATLLRFGARDVPWLLRTYNISYLSAGECRRFRQGCQGCITDGPKAEGNHARH